MHLIQPNLQKFMQPEDLKQRQEEEMAKGTAAEG